MFKKCHFILGFGDFFYEPAVGIIHGPEEFAEGLALGFKSLASNVLGGTAGALSRIGNRLGTGVAALTVDDKFQKERRERMNKATGLADSGRNLLRGFVSGLTGVVTKPIEGAIEEGVEGIHLKGSFDFSIHLVFFLGLFKGVGRGVVGVLAQPATGVIDFASGSLGAFNSVVDTKHVAKPVRAPRYFSSKHEITPYFVDKAKGFYLKIYLNFLFKTNNFSHLNFPGNQIFLNLAESKNTADEFESHFVFSSGYILLLTKYRLMFLKKSIITGNWESDWVEPWKNCSRVIRENNFRIRIITKVCFIR